MLSNPHPHWAEIQWIWRGSDGALKPINVLQVDQDGETHWLMCSAGCRRLSCALKMTHHYSVKDNLQPHLVPSHLCTCHFAALSLVLFSHLALAFLHTFSLCSLHVWWIVFSQLGDTVREGSHESLMCPVHKLLPHHQPWSSLNTFASLSVSQMIIRANQRTEWKLSRQEKNTFFYEDWNIFDQWGGGGGHTICPYTYSIYMHIHCILYYITCVCEGEKDGIFVTVIWAPSYCGSKVTSLSILPFSLSMLYWEVSLLISDNVLETWWEMDNIKASIGQWWQGCTAIQYGINSWICSQVRQSVSS